MRKSNGKGSLRAVQPPPDGEFDDEDMGVVGHKPYIPQGEYLARYLGHETAFMFARAPKVFLRFEICEGPCAEVRLFRPFRVAGLVGKAGPNGKFQLKAGGDLYRTAARVLDVKTRPDRISLKPMRNMLLRIGVRTVIKDRDGALLAEGALYSVIDSIEDGS